MEQYTLSWIWILNIIILVLSKLICRFYEISINILIGFFFFPFLYVCGNWQGGFKIQKNSKNLEFYKTSLKNKTNLENVHYQIATRNYIKLHYQNIEALVWKEENWSKIQKRKSTHSLTHICLIKFDSLPAVWETWVQPLGQEDPLEKEMATHFSILAWKFPWPEEPNRTTAHGVAESDTTEWLTLNLTVKQNKQTNKQTKKQQ